MRTFFAAALGAALLAVSATPADAAFRACGSIRDPAFLEGSRYEGADILRIRAQAVSCRTARRVARGATRKALGITPPPTGVKRFRFRAWSVADDLRGATDRFFARSSGSKRLRWRFG